MKVEVEEKEEGEEDGEEKEEGEEKDKGEEEEGEEEGGGGGGGGGVKGGRKTSKLLEKKEPKIRGKNDIVKKLEEMVNGEEKVFNTYIMRTQETRTRVDHTRSLHIYICHRS